MGLFYFKFFSIIFVLLLLVFVDVWVEGSMWEWVSFVVCSSWEEGLVCG